MENALKPLHDLMERLGDQSGILEELAIIADSIEHRYYTFTRRVGVAAIIVIAALVGALVWQRELLINLKHEANRAHGESNRAKAAAIRADKATDELEDIVQLNRGNIVDQCRQIEDLKIPIRTILRDSGAPERYIKLFKPHACTMKETP